MTWLSMSSRSSVDGAPYWCSRVMIQMLSGTQIVFFLPRSWYIYFTNYISLLYALHAFYFLLLNPLTFAVYVSLMWLKYRCFVHVLKSS